MLILISLLVFTVVIGLFVPDLNTNKRNKAIYLIVIFGLLSLVSGFRTNSVGIDTINYVSSYEYVRDHGIQGAKELSYRFEWGYLSLAFIVSRVFYSPTIFLLLFSTFISYSFALLFFRYSENVVMSSFLYIIYFFPSTMNTMRQYFALSILLFALPLLEEKKTIKYLIFVFIASLFHTTAVIFAFFAIITINKLKINIKFICLFSIIAILSLNFFDLILSVFFERFPQYERFMSSSKYAAQTNVDTFWVFFYIIITIFYVWYTEKQNQIAQNKTSGKLGTINMETMVNSRYIFCIIFIISIVCMFFMSKLWIVSRINSYFRFSLCLILPAVIHNSDNFFAKYKLFIYIGFYLIFGYIAYTMFMTDGHKILPLEFIFS